MRYAIQAHGWGQGGGGGGGGGLLLHKVGARTEGVALAYTTDHTNAISTQRYECRSNDMTLGDLRTTHLANLMRLGLF